MQGFMVKQLYKSLKCSMSCKKNTAKKIIVCHLIVSSIKHQIIILLKTYIRNASKTKHNAIKHA